MRLHTFGRLAVTTDDAEIRLQRRQLALLALLAAEGAEGLPRDRVLGLLAADREQGKARHTLDQTIYAVRRTLGADAIVSGAVALQIDRRLLSSDVVDFTAALARRDDASAVALYGGPFMDGVFLPDAPEFEQWMESRRAHFAGAFVQALVRLAARATAAGDHATAVQHLRRAAAIEPLSASIAHALMLALAHAGDQSAALSAARVHTAIVREQLDAEPDPSVSALEVELRAGRIQPAARSMPAPSRDEPAPAQRPVIAPATAAPGPRRRTAQVIGLPVAAALTIIVIASIAGALARRRPGYALRDVTQLTTNGVSHQASISADGRYLAYAAKECDSLGICRFNVDLLEIGTAVTRRIVDSAQLIDYLGWSPDSRNLLVAQSVKGPEGISIVSALGGAPRFLSPRFANFFAGGDSLLFIQPQRNDGVQWLAAAGLDGVAHDSFSVAVPGHGGMLDFVLSVPETVWLLVISHISDRWELRVLDRKGRVADRLAFTGEASEVRASRGAVWMSLPQGDNSVLVRIPFDSATGQLSSAVDTVYIGTFTDFDVTARGDRLVMDQQAAEVGLYAMDFKEAIRGRFAARRRLVSSSMNLDGTLSPDGATFLLAREIGSVPGGGFEFSLVPFGGGTERRLTARGDLVGARWATAGFAQIVERERDTMRLALLDVASGARSEELAFGHEVPRYFDHLPGGGWVWIAPDAHSVRFRRTAEPVTREFPVPAWFSRVQDVMASPDGRRVVFWGFNVAGDSMRIAVMSLSDGSTVPWWTMLAPWDAIADWFPDGSLRVRLHFPDRSRSFTRLPSPGRIEPLGTIPVPTGWVEVSTDMKRAMIITYDPRGDVWMSRVVPR